MPDAAVRTPRLPLAAARRHPGGPRGPASGARGGGAAGRRRRRTVGGSSASHIALTDDSVDSYEHNVIKLAEHSVLCSYHTEGGNLN